MVAGTCHSSVATIRSSAGSWNSFTATPPPTITKPLPSRGRSFLKSNQLISRGSLVYLPTMTLTTTSIHRPTIGLPAVAHLPLSKKGLSYYMPHRTVPWVNDVGNPTRSAEVNDLINEIKKFEVRGKGCQSSAKRPIREVEFRKTLELLRAQPSFDCKHKHPFLFTWQHHLIGRLDDCANFEVSDPRGHPEFDFACKTKVKWSKNVMEERRCPDQVCSFKSFLCSLPLFTFLSSNATSLFSHRSHLVPWIQSTVCSSTKPSTWKSFYDCTPTPSASSPRT